jgi:hypothetical protein
MSNNNQEVFGMKLIIDGQQVGGFRTFKKQGKYIGFREATGTYREFLFHTPKTADPENVNDLDCERMRNTGEINLKIFSTKKRFVEGKIEPKVVTMANQFVPAKRLTEKKFFKKSLAITKGGIFKKRQQFDFLGKSYDERTGLSETYEVDKRDVLISITIKYADFNALLIMGHLNLYRLEHLKYIPTHLFEKNHYLLDTVLKSILLKEKEGLNLRDLRQRFELYTERTFECAKIGDLSVFLSMSPLFKLINSNFVVVEEKKIRLSHTINDLKPNKLVPQSYFQSEISSKFKDNGSLHTPIIIGD